VRHIIAVFFEKNCEMGRQRLTTLILVIFAGITALKCSSSRLPSTEFLGLRIGMDRSSATEHLNQISQFIRDEGHHQELWRLKDPSSFGTVAVGYSKDKIRYITAFVEKNKREQPITFSSIGDINTARSEVAEPHFRYIWEIPATEQSPACSVSVYGDNPEFVTIYTLVGRNDNGEHAEDDDDD